MADMAQVLDGVARRVFTLALRDNRCGELLSHLFDGGGVTVDVSTGEMILLPADLLTQFSDGPEEPEEITPQL